MTDRLRQTRLRKRLDTDAMILTGEIVVVGEDVVEVACGVVTPGEDVATTETVAAWAVGEAVPVRHPVTVTSVSADLLVVDSGIPMSPVVTIRFGAAEEAAAGTIGAALRHHAQLVPGPDPDPAPGDPVWTGPPSPGPPVLPDAAVSDLDLVPHLPTGIHTSAGDRHPGAHPSPVVAAVEHVRALPRPTVDPDPQNVVDTLRHQAGAAAGVATSPELARDIAGPDPDLPPCQDLRAIPGRLVAARYGGRDEIVGADRREGVSALRRVGAEAEAPGGEVAVFQGVARPAAAGETGVTVRGTGAEGLPLLLQLSIRGANRLMVRALKTGLDLPNVTPLQALPTQ